MYLIKSTLKNVELMVPVNYNNILILFNSMICLYILPKINKTENR